MRCHQLKDGVRMRINERGSDIERNSTSLALFISQDICTSCVFIGITWGQDPLDFDSAQVELNMIE